MHNPDVYNVKKTRVLKSYRQINENATNLTVFRAVKYSNC